MNTYGKFLLCLCFLVVAADFTSAQEPTGDHVQSWQMAVLKKNGSVYESIPFYQPLSMTRTDSYQLYLGFNGKGFCYVIQEDDEGTLPFAYRKTVSPGDRITLPGEGRDFIAAGLPGTSRLYVIVSDHPRANLEKLLEHYEQGTDVVSLDRSILSEVFAIRRSVSSYPDAPELTIPAGNADPAMKGSLYLFEGRELWVITVTIRD